MERSARRFGFCIIILTVAFLLSASSAHAHIVPRQNHDRVIVVQLSKPNDHTLKISVAYRLEVDEYTVMAQDMRPFLDEVKGENPKERLKNYYPTYARIYSAIVAKNLIAKLDDKKLRFKCTNFTHSLVDENGTPYGHLRCDFAFEAIEKISKDKNLRFYIRDGMWELGPGKIDLCLLVDEIKVAELTQPSDALKAKELTQLGPGEPELLRRANALLVFAQVEEKGGPESKNSKTVKKAEDIATIDAHKHAGTSTAKNEHDTGLLALFRESKYSIWILLVLSTLIGAVHALTPGHGKTLVAAYLVGEQGTFLHALILGIVTTLTHTGIVLLVAVALMFVPQSFVTSTVFITQIIFGVLIAGIGFWLLICRVSGRADHVHIGGGHHHHHHGDGHHHHHHHHDHNHNHSHDHHHDHDHDHNHSHDHHHDHDHEPVHHHDHHHDVHGNTIAKEKQQPFGWWRLIVLGVQGGIVPCWDAVAMLFLAVGMGLLWVALPMLLAFSAGLAGVLVAVGIVVVSAKKFAQSHWGASRIVQALPVISACIVIVLGIWLVFDSVKDFRS